VILEQSIQNNSEVIVSIGKEQSTNNRTSIANFSLYSHPSTSSSNYEIAAFGPQIPTSLTSGILEMGTPFIGCS
jgi:hypothetical protein